MAKKFLKLSYLCLGMLLIFGMGMSLMAKTESNIKKALVVVDPGFSKASLNVAQAITDKLAKKGIAIQLKKANQFTAADLTGVDLLVLGGPTYMAKPSGALKKVVAKLVPGAVPALIIFQTGGSDCGGLAPLAEMLRVKNLNVIGECAFRVPKENAEIGNKIDKLL